MEFKDSHQLQRWLKENRIRLKKSISSSECKKWDKWIHNDEFPFPCACPIRNPECIFIETYYKLENTLELMRNEELYKSALKSYSVFKDNPAAVLEWTKATEQLGLGIIHFEPNLIIRVQTEPYLCNSIKLSTNEISQLLKFKEIFTECYYSEQYENY